MKMQTAVLAVVLLAMVCGSAGAVVITFEDLWPGFQTSGSLPAGYAGFSWMNGRWNTSQNQAPIPNGYFNTYTGNVGIFTPYADATWPISMGGRLFSIATLRVGAAWDDLQYVTFRGSRGGTVIYTDYFIAPWEGMTKTLNWTDIDLLEIIPDTSTGTAHPGMPGQGHQVCLDDLDVTYAPADPNTLTWNPITRNLALGGLDVPVSGWYALGAPAGSEVYIRVTRATSSVSGTFTLYDPDGGAHGNAVRVTSRNTLNFVYYYRGATLYRLNQASTSPMSLRAMYMANVGATQIAGVWTPGAHRLTHRFLAPNTVVANSEPFVP